MLLGMALAVGIFMAGKEAMAQMQPHTGQQHAPPPVNGGPVQQGNSTQPQPGMLPAIDPAAGGIGDPGIRARMDVERLKAANDDRHKKLVLDVDKLISLSNELKTDVDKTNKDELSLDVIRKAQEIEKLAHDVQSRMKN
jgi:hypothetical protein